MTSPGPLVDRRAALKERHRTAIVDAADALIRERGSARFSVDELADRADVSRRTVFNHFSSLDDVVTTACARELAVVIDTFEAQVVATPLGDGTFGSLFDEVAATLRATDLTPAIAYLGTALEHVRDPEASGVRIVQDTFHRVSSQLSLGVTERHPGAERLDVELLVSTLLHGIALVAERWADEAGARLDDASRARWAELLEHVLVTAKRGYPDDLPVRAPAGDRAR